MRPYLPCRCHWPCPRVYTTRATFARRTVILSATLLGAPLPRSLAGQTEDDFAVALFLNRDFDRRRGFGGVGLERAFLVKARATDHRARRARVGAVRVTARAHEKVRVVAVEVARDARLHAL